MTNNQKKVNKTIKYGQKADTHKCIFLYTERDWSVDAKKALAKSLKMIIIFLPDRKIPKCSANGYSSSTSNY